MWKSIVTSLDQWWFNATSPELQMVVFVVGALVALVGYHYFLKVLDHVFADVWAPDPDEDRRQQLQKVFPGHFGGSR